METELEVQKEKEFEILEVGEKVSTPPRLGPDPDIDRIPIQPTGGGGVFVGGDDFGNNDDFFLSDRSFNIENLIHESFVEIEFWCNQMTLIRNDNIQVLSRVSSTSGWPVPIGGDNFTGGFCSRLQTSQDQIIPTVSPNFFNGFWAFEVVVITLLLCLYITIISAIILWSVWGQKINKSGANRFTENSREGKREYWD